MKPLCILAILALLPLPATAEAAFVPRPAETVALEDIRFVSRAVVVFADSPEDPSFLRQMELLAGDPAALAERDVIVVTDTDPAARSAWRTRLRPRGFSLVVMDKDGVTTLRKPLPWDVREITRAIDKFPLARIEDQERHPSGR